MNIYKNVFEIICYTTVLHCTVTMCTKNVCTKILCEKSYIEILLCTIHIITFVFDEGLVAILKKCHKELTAIVFTDF